MIKYHKPTVDIWHSVSDSAIVLLILTGVWGEGAGWTVEGGAGDGLSCGEETKRI